MRLVAVIAPTGPISASPARLGRHGKARMRARLIEIATTTKPVSDASAASSAAKKLDHSGVSGMAGTSRASGLRYRMFPVWPSE